ncbi:MULTISPECIES: DUF3016 domain-containing protein [Gammaproteobacteria]|uniref:DUF3016 domain-containing protein n=1 Tax=Gammaproteobacteria TaxID=1236 RepID=UPI000DCFDB42|nr:MULTISPECIES: DUF3016 domain-containing protein [Gammaproteobacteria]RTE85682.1 DUF3016 domain-containing protein [Aliidiomarina sp. B3213]TCZ90316.1 DUF3016 domain-containing protein [Lysobacter sp. N42]
MKFLKVTLILALGIGISPVTFAGEASVTWSSPENYEDVRLAQIDPDNEELQVRFSRIARHIDRLAEMHLADGEELKITVTDYDMAGTMLANQGFNAREFERKAMMNEFPVMTIDFERVSADGTVVSSEQGVEIEGRAIRTEGRSRFPRISSRDEYVSAELNMLNRWFAQQFLSQE